MINTDINEILGITESYKAPETILKILYDRKRREKIFLEFLKEFNHDVSYDWFHKYFEDEHSDRKKKKQDFTPNSVSDIIARLVGAKGGMAYEIAAGTGGMTIRKWWSDCLSETPFTYFPSKHFYVCEELSDRAIPFLLFNLMIRGMNAAVVHCDVLSRECKGVFYVNNKKDDFLRFSDLNLMPYSKQVEDYFKVKFNNFRYPPIKEILESETI
jgi:type I restriction-modification system DNA methylase subunit